MYKIPAGHSSTERTLKSWIRLMVRIEPEIMKKVAKAEFGDLSEWLQKGAFKFGRCGCLVGTTALLLVEDRNSFELNPIIADGFCSTADFAYDQQGRRQNVSAYTVVNKLVKANPKLQTKLDNLTYGAGVAAVDLKFAFRQGSSSRSVANDKAVAVIKYWIRQELRARKLAGKQILRKVAK